MPIGLVSDELFQRELKSISGSDTIDDAPASVEEVTPPIEGIVETPVSRGRKEGDTNVPESLRKLIADEHLLNGREAALQLAKDFGISSSSVSAYAKGATSTTSYNAPNKSLLTHINKSRERAIKRASKTLNGALAAITQEKLDYADAKDLAGISKDMSVIIKNLEPKDVVEESGNKQTPQFVIFAPQFREEKSFEVINVQE